MCKKFLRKALMKHFIALIPNKGAKELMNFRPVALIPNKEGAKGFQA